MAETGFFTTEGWQYLLEAALSEEQSVPTNFYIGLVSDAHVQYASNLGTLTELTGNGYSGVAVASNGTDLTSESDGGTGRKMTTKVVRFTASGGAWSLVKWAILKTSSDASGKLIGAMRVNGSVGYTLADGQYVEVSMVLTLTHPTAASVSSSPSGSVSASPSASVSSSKSSSPSSSVSGSPSSSASA